MKIYVSRHGERYGPYSLGHVRTMLAAGQVKADDLACYEGSAEWLPLDTVLAIEKPVSPAYPCPRCGGELSYQVEKTDTGTGCIVILLGVLLAPILIGLVIIFFGIHLMGKTKTYWHCRSCGTVFPG